MNATSLLSLHLCAMFINIQQPACQSAFTATSYTIGFYQFETQLKDYGGNFVKNHVGTTLPLLGAFALKTARDKSLGSTFLTDYGDYSPSVGLDKYSISAQWHF